jgi:zinc transporter, ZIP family
MEVNAATVALAALATALATGLGAAPFAAFPTLGTRSLALANAGAAGFMLAAGAGLLREGRAHGTGRVLVGAGIGLLFIVAARSLLRGRREVHLGALSGADARKVLTIVGVMSVHSVAEGVGVGVSYGGGDALGLFITVAIAVHNIPEGLAISLVLVPRGSSVARAAWWSVFSSLPQPLLAVPAFLFVERFLPLLPYGLGFAAGAMAWMVVSELIPDARAGASARAVAVCLLLSFAAMMAFQALALGL